MEKSKVDGCVSASDHISHGLASSTSDNKTNLHNPRDTEVSTVSSERTHSAQQTSIRSEFSSDSGQLFNKRKDPEFSAMAGVSHGNSTTKVVNYNKLLKTESVSSKESGEVVQLSSVDSTDPIPSQSSNDCFVERKPYVTHSHESKAVSRLQQESSVTTKSDSVVANMQSLRHCKFDLNEGMEENGAESDSSIRASSSLVSEPISVVAKFGVPRGLPKKPLQFGGELGWKRSGTTSAFRPTSVKNPKREWIDLNVAASMDSDLSTDKTSANFTSKQPEKLSLDLNCLSESEEDHCKPGASSFNLNDDPSAEDTHNYQHSESRQRNSIAADTTCSRGNVNQSIVDMRRPPYWVDLSSMRGFSHVQSHPFVVAAPTADQVRMMVPSGVYIGKINNLPPTFYPTSVVPHISNQHGASGIPQFSGSVLAAYPGPLHFLEGSQGLNSHAFANVRPTFIPNGSVPLVENGTNPEFMIPVRNGLFETRQKPVEPLALPSAQNNRQMASWN